MATDDSDALRARYGRAWSRLDRDDRRRVMRAVNRMQPLDTPAEAALAITYAQRQRRLWVRWWWVLPAVNAAIGATRGWEAAVANLLIGVLMVGMFASLFTWRAGRSIKANREALEAAGKRRRSGSPKRRATAERTTAKRGPGGGRRRRR